VNALQWDVTVFSVTPLRHVLVFIERLRQVLRLLLGVRLELHLHLRVGLLWQRAHGRCQSVRARSQSPEISSKRTLRGPPTPGKRSPGRIASRDSRAAAAGKDKGTPGFNVT
jgi:hypothetical protein